MPFDNKSQQWRIKFRNILNKKAFHYVRLQHIILCVRYLVSRCEKWKILAIWARTSYYEWKINYNIIRRVCKKCINTKLVRAFCWIEEQKNRKMSRWKFLSIRLVDWEKKSRSFSVSLYLYKREIINQQQVKNNIFNNDAAMQIFKIIHLKSLNLVKSSELGEEENKISLIAVSKLK